LPPATALRNRLPSSRPASSFFHLGEALLRAAIKSTTGASFLGLSISTTLPPSSLVSISFFRLSRKSRGTFPGPVGRRALRLAGARPSLRRLQLNIRRRTLPPGALRRRSTWCADIRRPSVGAEQRVLAVVHGELGDRHIFAFLEGLGEQRIRPAAASSGPCSRKTR